MARPGWAAQVALVMGKTVKLKARNLMVTLTELLIPAVFLLFLLPAFLAASDSDLPGRFFLQSTFDQALVMSNHTCSLTGARGMKPCPAPFVATRQDYSCLGDMCLLFPHPDPSEGREVNGFKQAGVPLDDEEEEFVKAALMPLKYPFGSNAPTYDNVALLRRYANVVDLPGRRYDLGIIGDRRGSVFDALSTGYHVAVVPQDATDSTQVRLANELDAYLTNNTRTHVHTRLEFVDEGSALAYATDWDGLNKIWAIVVVKGEHSYAIRQNHTTVPDTGNEMFDRVGFDGSQGLYVGGGFVTLQLMINEFFSDGEYPVGDTAVVPMPLAPIRTNDFLESVAPFMSMLISFAMLYPVAQWTALIVKEKEERIREAMLIMGLSLSAFRGSWLLTTWMQFGFISILTTIPIAIYLPSTGYGLIFFHTLFYGLAIGEFVLVIATLFSKATTASTIAPFLFLGQALPALSLDPKQLVSGPWAFLPLFFPTAAHSGGLSTMIEGARKGEDVTAASFGDGTFPVGLSFFYLVWNILFYFLLWRYLDAVVPGEWGAKKPWYVCCVPTLWCNEREPEPPGPDACLNPHFVEPMTGEGDAHVAVQSLRKEFPGADSHCPTRVAVDNVNLTLREGQIFSLLGHNGAGKTTLINMLTGMLPATSGDADIYGNSVAKDMRKIRGDIGLCPQHNILWDKITCEEHLHFFAKLKGVPSDARAAVVKEMLDEVELSERTGFFSSALSGGMKRKLCVAIALIGGSRFVIFDEPTAGMDVEARRAVWEMLKKAKKGRTVLLTTHYMDEADLLGDSIAIMTQGRVYCWGSSYFLKQKLGVGYQLKLDVDAGAASVDATTKRVQGLLIEKLSGLAGNISDAAHLSSAGSEVSFRLPEWGISQFEALFTALDNESAALGIRNYSVAMTTLEELYLKIANEEHGPASSPSGDAPDFVVSEPSGEAPASDSSPNSAPGTAATPQSQPAAEPSADDIAHLTNQTPLRGSGLYKSQLSALVKKRLRYARRDRCAMCLQVILPVVLILMALILNDFPLSDPDSLTMSALTDHRKQTVVVGPSDNPFLPYYKSDGFETSEPKDPVTAEEFEQYLYDTYYSHGLPAEKRWHACFAAVADPANATNATNEGDTDGRWASVLQNEKDGSGDEKETNPFAAATALVKKEWNRVMYYNITSFHSSVRAIAVQGTAQLRDRFNSPTRTLVAENHPLPKGKFVQNIASAFEAVTLGIFVLIPFAFVPANPVSFLVKERETKAKHVQVVSGVRLSAYWLSNFIFDMASYFFTVMLAVGIFLAFWRTEYVGTASNFFATIFLFVSYGLTANMTSYLASFYFKNANVAQNVVMLFNFLSGCGLVIFTFIMEILGYSDEMKIVKFFFRLVPSFCLGDAVVQLSLREGLNEIGVQDLSPWDLDVTGWSIIFLLLSFPLYTLLAMAHDYPHLAALCYKLSKDGDNDPPRSIKQEVGGAVVVDDDVLAEAARILSTSPGDSTNPVEVKHLRKVYPNGTVAVKDLSFGIKTGEIFGFLGTNGAGKTTTISVIAGEFRPTEGRAFVKGYDVVGQALEAKRELGFCPQFDALHDLLTPRELLELYAGLRGVPNDQRRTLMIDTLVRLLGLGEHMNTISKGLSGGNRRKTSVAIALIGGPACVLLDEPTAGMDPLARRGMWKTLQLIAADRSVLLTTHHLEEVEALAHRMGIMVDGELRCVGTLGHLRSKFGGSQQFELNTGSEEAEARVMEWVPGEFANAQLVERTNLRLTYQIAEKLPLAQLFGKFEQMKGELGISDYAISETSIEQVFAAICKRKEHEARHNSTMTMVETEDSGAVEVRTDQVRPLSAE